MYFLTMFIVQNKIGFKKHGVGGFSKFKEQKSIEYNYKIENR